MPSSHVADDIEVQHVTLSSFSFDGLGSAPSLFDLSLCADSHDRCAMRADGGQPIDVWRLQPPRRAGAAGLYLQNPPAGPADPESNGRDQR